MQIGSSACELTQNYDQNNVCCVTPTCQPIPITFEISFFYQTYFKSNYSMFNTIHSYNNMNNCDDEENTLFIDASFHRREIFEKSHAEIIGCYFKSNFFNNQLANISVVIDVGSCKYVLLKYDDDSMDVRLDVVLITILK